MNRSFPKPTHSFQHRPPIGSIVVRLAAVLLAVGSMHGQAPKAACPRPSAGATLENPPELRSQNGALELGLHLRYQQTLVSEGPPRYCYVTDDGLESPTLRVHPGDRLVIHLYNDLPEWRGLRAPGHPMQGAPDDDCTSVSMDPSVTNLHFHGMTIPPVCHQDEVIRTTIPAGKEFDYRVTIPADEPPGLYWYHPHPHGYSERQVQGGASGAIIVEGIEKAMPGLVGIEQRVLVLRDQQRIGPEAPSATVPAWDISANFVPITYSQGQPAVMRIEEGKKELWRVVNAGGDVIFNLQLLVNQVTQPVEMAAVDGVPLSTAKAAAFPRQTSVLLPPGARAEFVVSAPRSGQRAELVTQSWDTGPQGDNDTARTIATIVTAGSANERAGKPGPRKSPANKAAVQTSSGPPSIRDRMLYFSQRSGNPQDPDNFVLYFITLEGQTPEAYRMGMPPNIVVHQGDVEDWTVENRSPEDHVFHIHQIHFRVLAIDGKQVDDATERDTIDVPYWKGEGPYPSVKLRMDFSDPNDVGTFLYHCHILKHEDMGMMGSIQVLAKDQKSEVRGSTDGTRILHPANR